MQMSFTRYFVPLTSRLPRSMKTTHSTLTVTRLQYAQYAVSAISTTVFYACHYYHAHIRTQARV